MNDPNLYENPDDSIEEEELPQEEYASFGIRSQFLTVMQLIACVLILISAFVIKLIGGEVYSESASWFYEKYNDSVFINMNVTLPDFKDWVNFSETSTISPETSTIPKESSA